MPLVLVHNDVVSNPAHAWDDVEGVQYHYPAKYQTKVKTGEPFVYYRGVHREGGKRGPAEYVGAGRIGAIWLDPERPSGRNRAWYCRIENYQRFAEPVAAKVNGVLREQIPSNLWRDGVRSLDPQTYAEIMGAAQSRADRSEAPSPRVVVVATSDQLIVPAPPSSVKLAAPRPRRSKRAKLIGDWAELIVMRHLQDTLLDITELTHRAAGGETPGWDIDFRDATGRLQRVEVKGTIGGGFTGIELTAGELRAAQAHGADFWLYLVAGCLTDRPKVQAVKDPAGRLASGGWTATPILYTVKF